MGLSQLAKSIGESPTLRLNEEAQTLRAKGLPVINLAVGEPKNKAPITAILGSTSLLKLGEGKYSPTDGTPSLKKAIIRYTEENYGRLVAPENVIVSTGAKQSLFNLMFSILNPQDEVVILAPYWVSYPEIVKLCYGIPVIVTPEDGTFHPRLEDILDAVSSNTKAIIINSPSNPAGVLIRPEVLGELVEYCESHSIYLIMDDIYHRLVFDGKRAVPAYDFTARDIENTHVIILNGVSKLYGMTGFRIGWAIGPRRLVEVMTNVQGQTTSCPSVVSQAAAEGALNGVQNVVENLRLTIQNNRDIVLDELTSMPDLRVIKPEGTFYVLPDFRAYNGNSVELCNFLLKKALVVTVPGKEFGMEGHVRLSYSGAAKQLIEAIERIRWAVDPNAPNEIYIGDRKMVWDWL